MSNRHQRRIEERAMRREAQGTHLVTHLCASDANLGRFPLLSRARAHWISNIASRRPYCCHCEANFADGATTGAFLFATLPSDPGVCSVSALCVDCHRDLSDRDIEATCQRVLQRLWPGGTFLDRGTSP